MAATSIKNTHNRQQEILNWKLKNDFLQARSSNINTQTRVGDRLSECWTLVGARFSLFSRFSFLPPDSTPDFTRRPHRQQVALLNAFRTSTFPFNSSLKFSPHSFVCWWIQSALAGGFPACISINIFTCWTERTETSLAVFTSCFVRQLMRIFNSSLIRIKQAKCCFALNCQFYCKIKCNSAN